MVALPGWHEGCLVASAKLRARVESGIRQVTMSHDSRRERERVRPKILIVEDDPHSREGLRQWLLSAGYSVETAAEGWQAFKQVKEHRFDVAITDLELPTDYRVAMTGWDLVRIFRAYNPCISIIVLSAEDSEVGRTLAAELGVSEYLVKPVNLIELKTVVGSLAAEPATPAAAPREEHAPSGERRSGIMKKLALLILVVALITTACSGLTAREKGALVGGSGGAAGGALFGAAAGNAALGAAIGGPVGLVGGYFLGDKFFRDDPGRR
jgi:CheY-like chemotaxis protein